MDNTSFIPDIYIGRIPVSNDTEANPVLNKIIRAEMCPVEEKTFYSNAIHCAAFEPKPDTEGTEEHYRFILTSQEIRDYVATHGILANRYYSAPNDVNPKYYNKGPHAFGQAIPLELQRPYFKWTCTPEKITDRFNKGALYALYRGHGSTQGWMQVNYRISDLAGLENEDLCSSVFSITCLSGAFNNNCFAENLLRLPYSGASSVIAASAISLPGYNDSFAEGMIDAIWPDPGIVPQFNDPRIGSNFRPVVPAYRLGQIKEQGLFRMMEQWGTIDPMTIRYQYEVFNLFGDPSMMFFTDVPKPFSNVDIQRYGNEIYINTHGETAIISFYNSTTDEAIRFEAQEMSFYTDDPENTSVCLTGHNRRTYLDGILVPAENNEGLRPSILKWSSDNEAASIKLSTGEESGSIELAVSDITGTYHHSIMLEPGLEIREVSLPLPESKGVYVITLKQDNRILETKKIIK